MHDKSVPFDRVRLPTAPGPNKEESSSAGPVAALTDLKDHGLAANLRMIEHSRSTGPRYRWYQRRVRDKGAEIER